MNVIPTYFHREGLNRFAGIADPSPNVDAKTVERAVDNCAVKVSFAEGCSCMGATIVDGRNSISHAKNCKF